MIRINVYLFALVFVSSRCFGQDVIIIGAGVSGIGAARTLVDHGGFNVTVLEANPDRYGGRMWTNTEITSDGSAIDLGASFIHSASPLNPIRQLADEIGLDLNPVAYLSTAGWDEETGEQFTPLELLNTVFDFASLGIILSQASENYDEDTSVYGAAEIEGLLPEWLDPANQMIVNMMESGSGGPQNNMSVKLLDTFWNSLSYGGMDVIFPNGYIEILDYLVEGNGTQQPLDIRLGQTVTNINIDDITERVEVVTSNGDVYYADAAVISVSLGILKSEQITFSPSLPEYKQTATDRLGFGILNKVVLEFDEAFWGGTNWMLLAASDLDESSMGTTYMNLQAVEERPILVAFAGGQDAIDNEDLSDEEIIQIALDRLSSIVGYDVTVNQTLVSSARTRWYNNPYTLGSYSFPAVGGSPDDWNLLSLPVCPGLYFAGEHTNSDRWATVDGAYSSGLRAAQQVIEGIQC